ncbi:MAG: hypothetical protein U0821_09460 [Chloroflexota bacterium]
MARASAGDARGLRLGGAIRDGKHDAGVGNAIGAFTGAASHVFELGTLTGGHRAEGMQPRTAHQAAPRSAAPPRMPSSVAPCPSQRRHLSLVTLLSTDPLATAEGATLLTITESGFDQIPTARRAQAFEANEGGWEHQMALIQKYLAAQAPS